ALLSRHDSEYLHVLRQFDTYAAGLLAIASEEASPSEPHWRNGYLFGIDGVSLYAFTRDRAPRRYIEVGSGHSTLFVDRARRDGAISMEIVSIDPCPRREIDAISEHVIRQPLECVDLNVFGRLQ